VDENRPFLVYRLRKKYLHSETLELGFYKTKHLKSGRLGKGKQLSAEHVCGNYYHETLKNEEDHRLLGLVGPLLKYYYSETVEVTGKVGALLLKELVATGRFYAFDETPILFSSERVSPKLFFEKSGERYRIRLNLDRERFFLLETDPMIVYDARENSLREVDLDLQAFQWIRKAPPISEKLLPSVYGRVVDQMPQLPLDIPDTIETEKLTVTPKPVLQLSGSEQAHGHTWMLRLLFDYANYRILPLPCHESEQRMRGNVLCSIQRDPLAESQARQRLEALGLDLQESDRELNARLDRGEGFQERLTQWRTFLTKPSRSSNGKAGLSKGKISVSALLKG